MTTMYGHRSDRGRFEDIHEAQAQVRMCGDGPVLKLRAAEIPAADDHGEAYWGWEDSGRPGKFSMVFHSMTLLGVCFAYGMDAEVKAGKGRPVPLRIEEDE